MISSIADFTYFRSVDSFIRAKYSAKRWAMDGPVPDPDTLPDAPGQVTERSISNIIMLTGIPQPPTVSAPVSKPAAVQQQALFQSAPKATTTSHMDDLLSLAAPSSTKPHPSSIITAPSQSNFINPMSQFTDFQSPAGFSGFQAPPNFGTTSAAPSMPNSASAFNKGHNFNDVFNNPPPPNARNPSHQVTMSISPMQNTGFGGMSQSSPPFSNMSSSGMNGFSNVQQQSGGQSNMTMQPNSGYMSPQGQQNMGTFGAPPSQGINGFSTMMPNTGAGAPIQQNPSQFGMQSLSPQKSGTQSPDFGIFMSSSSAPNSQPNGAGPAKPSTQQAGDDMFGGLKW